MRYIQTYFDLTVEHIFNGVLSQSFFCSVILHACDTEEYRRATLQFYQERVELSVKPGSLDANNFADNLYETDIRGKEDTLQEYKILHLSDLSVDLKYVAGSSYDCRDFRCCHADRDGEIDFNSDTAAGPYGARGCDLPLSGAKSLLTGLKAKVLESYGEINMVVVTGNVVTHQPGQLNASDHIQTMEEVYAMIQEVFADSFIFPVIGSQDVFPAKFFPFDNRKENTESWSPENKKAQYIDKSVEVVTAIIDDWKLKYPFNDEHREV